MLLTPEAVQSTLMSLGQHYDEMCKFIESHPLPHTGSYEKGSAEDVAISRIYDGYHAMLNSIREHALDLYRTTNAQ